MSNIVLFEQRRKKDFKKFLADNKDKIYANTPRINSVSTDDEWVDETEWEEMFQELSVKEN